MVERNELIIVVYSKRNVEKAKFKFKICVFMFGLEPEVTKSYDEIN
jgi:hypothetical protein